MKCMHFLNAVVILVLFTSITTAHSEQFKQFSRDYETLHQDLLNHEGEEIEVSGLVYTKDAVTLTFQKGTIYLQRYVNNRPTTAIFVGEGHAKIEIPSHVERQSLFAVTGDSIVDQSFTTCFIRMADNFDRVVKEHNDAHQAELKWSAFNISSKKSKGEYFFKPVVFHLYDNYFQLLRSTYERNADGYFWINFNRYVFTFDPNRPEGVRVSYELEGGDILPTDAAVLQSKERNVYADSAMSRLAYATRLLSKKGRFELGGANGLRMESGEGCLELEVTQDSLRFLSLLLDKRLTLDSIHCASRRIEFWRRKDFLFVGAILPEYVYRHDTLNVVLWYHGEDYTNPLPLTEDPSAVPHHLTLIAPLGVNYLFADSATTTALDESRQEVVVMSERPYSSYLFTSLSTGFDTVQVESQIGQRLDFIEPDRLSDDQRKRTIDYSVSCFNSLTSLLGPPNSALPLAVSSRRRSCDMPGIITGPLGSDDQYLGGWHHAYAHAVARQWFARAASSLTHRETWMLEAFSQYAALMVVQREVGSSEFYRNVIGRRNSIFKLMERGMCDVPLAAGSGASTTLRSNKGVCLIHMLRWLMYDLDRQSEDRFLALLRDISTHITRTGFTNQSFVQLAEQHYGGSLEPIFRYWLYGSGFPEYEVTYTVEEAEDEYFLSAQVIDNGRQVLKEMPVMIRIELPGRSEFHRVSISGPVDTLVFGPFASKPEEFHFNEFASVPAEVEMRRK